MRGDGEEAEVQSQGKVGAGGRRKPEMKPEVWPGWRGSRKHRKGEQKLMGKQRRAERKLNWKNKKQIM